MPHCRIARFITRPIVVNATLVAALVLGFTAAPSPARAQVRTPLASEAPAVPVSIETQAAQLGLTVQGLTQLQAFAADKASRTPAQQKMDSHLIGAARIAQGGPEVPTLPDFQGQSAELIDATGRVAVDIRGDAGPALQNAVASAGGQNITPFPQFGVITARVPAKNLESLAARDDVSFISVSAPPRARVGAKTSQGDATHGAATFRTTNGADGTGAKVGVLSTDSYNLSTSQSTGDLGPVTVIADVATPSDGEGTAMLEIVHDLAPGANLYFAGTTSLFQMAANIRNMVDNYGVNVLVDDIYFSNEGVFQNDALAQAVNYASSKNIPFFSAAGNAGNFSAGTASVWEGDFLKNGTLAVVFSPTSTITYDVHQFGTDALGNAVLFNATTDGQYSLATLQWSDPLNKSGNDYDLFCFNANGTIYSAGTSNQIGNSSPYEACNRAPGTKMYVLGYNMPAPRALHLDAFGYGNTKALTYTTNGDTFGHSATNSVIGVSAAPTNRDAFNTFNGPFPGLFTSVSQTEKFTSDGPRRLFYTDTGAAITKNNVFFNYSGGILLQQPLLTAANGVTTTVPGFAPFYGTSAAAPHAAALAALVRSLNGMYGPAFVQGLLLTRDEITSLMTATATNGTVWNQTGGYGFPQLGPPNPIAPVTGGLLNALKNFATVTFKNVREKSLDITYTTPLPSDTNVTYVANGITRTITVPGISTNHTVTLTGLSPQTAYPFRITATTPTGSVVYSETSDRFAITSGTVASSFAVVGVSSTGASVLKAGTSYVANVVLKNTGTGIADKITITTATLGGVMVSPSSVPLAVGSGVIPNATISAALRFPTTVPTGTQTLSVTGTYVTSGSAVLVPFSGVVSVKVP